jgi:hypothetical protein
LRHVLPALGDFRIHPEDDFADADEVASFVRAQKITRVLLLNPYGNGHRLSIYRRLRDLKIPYYVFDRGALPESWFFDPNGFNFDSDSYAPSMWDKPLTQSETRQVENYISDLRSSADALEENGSRTSSRHLRERFGIGARKVLFVPFQRPSDTVTTYFAGPSGSVAGFQSWVAYVASKLPKSEWTVICKNHPLERNLPRIEGVMYADDSVHVHDLLELADKVFLMNSGVGVLAMAFGKPVICAAKAFYDHPGICHSVETKEEALDLVKREVAVSEEKCKRFIWHLRRRVYSFGQSKYKKTVGADGADRNMVMEIIFESIRFLGSEEVRLGRPRAGVSLDAPLFASFGGRVGVKASIASKRTANNTPLPGSAPPAPATAATSHGVDLAADTPAAAKGSMQTQINRLEASDALVSTVQRVSSGNIEESQTRLGVPAAHEASVRPAGSGWSETTGGRRQVALDFQQKRHAIGRRGETTSSGRGLLRGLLKSRPSA